MDTTATRWPELRRSLLNVSSR